MNSANSVTRDFPSVNSSVVRFPQSIPPEPTNQISQAELHNWPRFAALRVTPKPRPTRRSPSCWPGSRLAPRSRPVSMTPGSAKTLAALCLGKRSSASGEAPRLRWRQVLRARAQRDKAHNENSLEVRINRSGAFARGPGARATNPAFCLQASRGRGEKRCELTVNAVEAEIEGIHRLRTYTRRVAAGSSVGAPRLGRRCRSTQGRTGTGSTAPELNCEVEAEPANEPAQGGCVVQGKAMRTTEADNDTQDRPRSRRIDRRSVPRVPTQRTALRAGRTNSLGTS